MQGTGTLDLKFSHIGLFVTDLARMVAFYRGALRFTQTDTGRLGPVELAFLSRDASEHHQIVLAAGRPADVPFNVVNQISFRVPDLPTLRRFHQCLLAHGASDVQPVTHGNAISVYCRDPEGNRLELFIDTPWYCEQPLREPLDFAQSDEAIMQRTEAIASSRPGFRSREAWQAEVARRMTEDQRADQGA
jgi:catechol 2,3-dioxygenase-like lactoylglutathione lyase family enzyme